jgi:hypothetical protein
MTSEMGAPSQLLAVGKAGLIGDTVPGGPAREVLFP